MPLKVEFYDSLAGIERSEWDKLYGPCAEGVGYMLACEKMKTNHFNIGAMAVRDNEHLVGGVPTFQGQMSFAMLLPDTVKNLLKNFTGGSAGRHSLLLFGLGSPHADDLALTIDADQSSEDRNSVLRALLDKIYDQGCKANARLMMVKDVSHHDSEEFHQIFTDKGFTRFPSLPVAVLHVPFKSEHEYLNSLSKNRRHKLRKLARKAADIEAEVVSSHEEAIAYGKTLWELRENTRRKAKTHFDEFEKLPEDYFTQVIRHLPDHFYLRLYRFQGRIIAFSLAYFEDKRLMKKDIGMEYPIGLEKHIWYYDLLLGINDAIERGVEWVQIGPTTYQPKVSCGCKLLRRWVYVRHRIGMVNQLMKSAASLFSVVDLDPDLKTLGAHGPHFTDFTPNDYPTYLTRTFDLRLMLDN